jgi:hypothetical protein
VLAHLKALDDPRARFVCVCGKKVWLETEPQAVVRA